MNATSPLRIGMVMAAMAVVGAVALPGVATTYDLKADFSTTSGNPNGAWSYNEGVTPLPYVQGNWGSTPGYLAWTTTASGTLPPAVGVMSGSSPGHWDAGDILVHSTTPGSGPGLGNITWTSPGEGVISISGQAWDGYHDPGRDDAWRLLVNGVLVSQRSSIVGVGESSSNALFSNNVVAGQTLSGISVHAGDVVRFEVQALTGYGHFTGVDMTIDYAATSPVPEPLTMFSAFLALGGLGTYIRRRARSEARANP